MLCHGPMSCLQKKKGAPRRHTLRQAGSGLRVPGSGFWVPGSGCRVLGAGSRVPGAGFRVPGAGCRVPGAMSCAGRRAAQCAMRRRAGCCAVGCAILCPDLRLLSRQHQVYVCFSSTICLQISSDSRSGSLNRHSIHSGKKQRRPSGTLTQFEVGHNDVNSNVVIHGRACESTRDATAHSGICNDCGNRRPSSR